MMIIHGSWPNFRRNVDTIFAWCVWLCVNTEWQTVSGTLSWAAAPSAGELLDLVLHLLVYRANLLKKQPDLDKAAHNGVAVNGQPLGLA